MNKRIPVTAVFAALALGACNNEPETVSANTPDPQAQALANAAPVQLPPAITRNRAYRCDDNSLYYVDFYNNQTARISTTRSGEQTLLTAAEGNPPYAGEGYSLSGDGENVTINGKSCHI
jgi:hypothetical protein